MPVRLESNSTALTLDEISEAEAHTRRLDNINSSSPCAIAQDLKLHWLNSISQITVGLVFLPNGLFSASEGRESDDLSIAGCLCIEQYSTKSRKKLFVSTFERHLVPINTHVMRRRGAIVEDQKCVHVLNALKLIAVSFLIYLANARVNGMRIFLEFTSSFECTGRFSA